MRRFIETLLMLACGLPIGFFFIGLSALSGQGGHFEGWVIMALSLLAFFAGLYAVYLHSLFEQQQIEALLIAESEAQHLARYERPIEAMSEYCALKAYERQQNRMRAAQNRLRFEREHKGTLSNYRFGEGSPADLV